MICPFDRKDWVCRKTVYGATKKEAQDRLLALQQQGAAGIIATTNMKMNAFLELWLAGIKTKVAPSTHDRYALDVNQHLIPGSGACN